MKQMINIYELLGGDRHDTKNNVLKSLFIIGINGDTVDIEAEPYDDAYDTSDMTKTMKKISRILDRREKAIFKHLHLLYGKEIRCLSITFFDEWRVYDGAYKYLGEACQIGYA